MWSGNARGASRTTKDSSVSRKTERRVRGRSACAAASSSVVRPVFDQLENRRMLTIIQPAGQNYLGFEAEHAEAVITDLDADSQTWQRTNTSLAGINTVPSGS